MEQEDSLNYTIIPTKHNKPEPRTNKAVKKMVKPKPEPKTNVDTQEQLPESEQVFLRMLSNDERAYLKKISQAEERIRKKLMKG
jgi:hypothetical protein